MKRIPIGIFIIFVAFVFACNGNPETDGDGESQEDINGIGTDKSVPSASSDFTGYSSFDSTSEKISYEEVADFTASYTLTFDLTTFNVKEGEGNAQSIPAEGSPLSLLSGDLAVYYTGALNSNDGQICINGDDYKVTSAGEGGTETTTYTCADKRLSIVSSGATVTGGSDFHGLYTTLPTVSSSGSDVVSSVSFSSSYLYTQSGAGSGGAQDGNRPASPGEGGQGGQPFMPGGRHQVVLFVKC